MGFHNILFLCLSLVGVSSVTSITLHYSSPGGSHAFAGVYRILVDVDSILDGSPADEQKPDHTCASMGNGFKKGISVRSLSYDEEAGQILIQLSDLNDQKSTVFNGTICNYQDTCSSDKLDTVMDELMSGDYGMITPIASWNGELYFIYTPNGNEVVYFGYQSSLQLRKIKEGQRLSRRSPLPIDDFSTHIATIEAGDTDSRWLHAGGNLLIVPGESEDHVFLTVVRAALYPNPPRDTDFQEFGFALVVAAKSSEGDYEAKVLHLTEDTWKGWYGHTIEMEGGVSYKDGTLCWSVVDEIFCGEWSPEQPLTSPTDVSAVLPPGMGSQVCTGTTYTDAYQNVTTGVALVETPEENGRLALFFGCFGTAMSVGGMGLLVHNPEEGNTEIVKVTAGDQPVLAGSIFTTPDNRCPQDLAPPPPPVSVAPTLQCQFTLQAFTIVILVMASFTRF